MFVSYFVFKWKAEFAERLIFICSQGCSINLSKEPKFFKSDFHSEYSCQYTNFMQIEVFHSVVFINVSLNVRFVSLGIDYCPAHIPMMPSFGHHLNISFGSAVMSLQEQTMRQTALSFQLICQCCLHKNSQDANMIYLFILFCRIALRLCARYIKFVRLIMNYIVLSLNYIFEFILDKSSGKTVDFLVK